MSRYNIPIRNSCDVVITDWNALDRDHSNDFNARIGMVDQSQPDNFELTYGWKLPCDEDGNRVTYRSANTNAADDQANVDKIIRQARRAGGTVYAGFWWPDVSLISDGLSNWNTQSSIRQRFRAMYMRFRNSQFKLPKFCIHTGSLLSQWDSNSLPAALPPPAHSGGTGLNFSNFVADWVIEAAKSDYWYTPADAQSGYQSRPILLLYNDASTPWTAALVTTIRNAFTGASLPNPMIYMSDITSCTTFGADGTYNYCGPAKTGFGTTHKKWNDMRDNLISFFDESASSSKPLPSIDTTNDGRPRALNDVDPSTYVEAETIIRRARDWTLSNPKFNVANAILVANLGEYDESSALGSTPQIRGFGASTFLGPYLDALKNVLSRSYPAPVWVAYPARTLHADITRVNWSTLSSDQTTGGGAYQFEEMRTSTAGATFTIAPALACDRIVVYCSKGTIYGGMNATLDGGAPTGIVLTAGSTTRTFNDPPIVVSGSVDLGTPTYDTGDLAAGAHSLVLTQTSGTVCVDLILVRVTANRG